MRVFIWDTLGSSYLGGSAVVVAETPTAAAELLAEEHGGVLQFAGPGRRRNHPVMTRDALVEYLLNEVAPRELRTTEAAIAHFWDGDY